MLQIIVFRQIKQEKKWSKNLVSVYFLSTHPKSLNKSTVFLGVTLV